MSQPRLHVRLWVDDELVVDRDLWSTDDVSALATADAQQALAGGHYKLEISDPDGELPTFVEERNR